jgi:enolase
MPNKIKDLKAREILDSRGNPTVSVTVVLDSGISATASVPSGASTGAHEALELRDGDSKRYDGKGVLKAVKNVEVVIRKKIVGMDVTAQRRIDETMLAFDGTENKSMLGANAILGVSLACARAAAMAKKQPLYAYLRKTFGIAKKEWKMPLPMMNVLNGGAHADWSIDLQECLIIPKQKTFKERVRAGAEVFHALKRILKDEGYAVTVGDEGGYAPKLPSNEKAFSLILDAVEDAGYLPGKDIALGSDAAASEFYDEDKGVYALRAEGKTLEPKKLIAFYEDLLKKYPLMTLEDPLAEDDWENWEDITAKLGKKLVLVGDDIFVTNMRRVERGVNRRIANAVLIKPNQIGTLSETMDTIMLAQENGYQIAVSHRSGETADTFIADLAVAVGAEFIKTGSLSRSERSEKYNRLMEIEDEIGPKK